MAILLTGHPAQQMFWGPTLLSLERYPGPVILAYDDVDAAPIPAEILDRFDAVVETGHPAGSLGHGPGELVCLREGLAAAVDLGAPYVLKVGADRPIWRWRNLPDLIALLEPDLDCLDCETAILFGRPAPLARALQLEDVAARKGSAESYWQMATAAAGVRRQCRKDPSWWERQLGALHIHGEYCRNAGQGMRWSWSFGELWPRPKIETAADAEDAEAEEVSEVNAVNEVSDPADEEDSYDDAL